MTTETMTKPNDLAEIIDKSGMTKEKAVALVAPLVAIAEQARTLIDESKSISVTDATQLTEMREAGELRKRLVKVRTGADTQHRALKADVLLYGGLLDKCRKKITDECEAAEARLRSMEDFAVRAETARKAKLRDERYTALAQVGPVDAAIVGTLGDMKAEAFDAMLQGARLAKEAREAEAAKQEQARKDEQEKRARELKEAQEAAQKAQAEAEKLRVERAEADRKAQAAAAEARKAQEATEAKARKEREAAAEKLRVEREAREKLEREAREREAAEKKRKDAEAQAAKKAAAAPDAEKLRALAVLVANLPMPEMGTSEGAATLRNIQTGMANMVSQINRAADSIGGAA